MGREYVRRNDTVGMTTRRRRGEKTAPCVSDGNREIAPRSSALLKNKSTLFVVSSSFSLSIIYNNRVPTCVLLNTGKKRGEKYNWRGYIRYGRKCHFQPAVEGQVFPEKNFRTVSGLPANIAVFKKSRLKIRKRNLLSSHYFRRNLIEEDNLLPQAARNLLRLSPRTISRYASSGD